MNNGTSTSCQDRYE